MPNKKLNAKEQRLLEEKIKFSFETDTVITDEEIDAIKQSAFEDYMNSQEYKQKSNLRKEKARTIAKRLVAVTAVAIILFVAPFVYSVLMPVTMSKADNFMRKAAIWMNDTLHLGIDVSVPAPKDDQSNAKTETALVDPAIEELASVSSLPIVYIPMNETVTLDSVTHNNELIDFEQVFIQYKVNGQDTIMIRIIPSFHSSTIAIDETISQISTKAGSCYAWDSETGSQAVCYISDCKVDIFSTLPLMDFVVICSTLSIVN